MVRRPNAFHPEPTSQRRTLPWVIADLHDGEWRGPRAVGNVNDALQSLRDLDGFLGAALVDVTDGAVVCGLVEDGAIDLVSAAEGNAALLRAMRAVNAALENRDEVEDVLITCARDWHLLRPLRGRPSIFFLLAVERDLGSLAIARLRLAVAESLLLF